MDKYQQIVSDYYNFFNESNHEALLQLLTEDVVHDINQGQADIGREAFAKFLLHMDECYREQICDLVVFPANGKRVAAESFVEGCYLKTDPGLADYDIDTPAKRQTYRLRVGAFFEFREEKICRVTVYYNLTDWIRQVSQT